MGDVNEILKSLGPGTGQQLYFDILLYWLFFINFVILFIDGSSFGTNITMAVLLFIFIDKTFAFGYMFNPKNGIYDNDPQTCHAKVFIGTYLIRTGMFAGAFAVAGSTSKGKVRAVGILAGLSAVVYMLGRWYFEQRDYETSTITCENTDIVIQNVGMILVLAKVMLRDRLSLGAVYRHIPITITRDSAAHDVEV